MSPDRGLQSLPAVLRPQVIAIRVRLTSETRNGDWGSRPIDPLGAERLPSIKLVVARQTFV